MRMAIFSDIHSNYEALSVVVAGLAEQRVDRYVCLGDVVGYGASPNECIELLQSLPNCLCLLGNHDAAVLGIPSPMGGPARRVVEWTKGVLTRTATWFLLEMEDIITWRDLCFCHANPYRPRRWYYVSEKQAISSSFARTKAKLLFVGHTHVPLAITRKNFFCVYIRSPLHTMEVPVAELNRQLFNCGSIGQPRDGDPRASYLIYDDEKMAIEFYRVDYDVAAAAGKILAAGLPEPFANRLLDGI